MAEYVIGYVYQLTDFNTAGALDAIPDERGARADGSPPFNFQLNSGASPITIIIDDDDPNLDEIADNRSGTQILAQDVTIDGTIYTAGQQVLVNYELTGPGVPPVYSISIGQNNSGRNETTALITTEPLTPGTTYTYTAEGNIGNNSRPADAFVCFVRGTCIKTQNGYVPIEKITVGDLIWTKGSGYQPVRWIGSATVSGLNNMAPIQFDEGAIGNTKDLCVSPAHRMLVTGYLAEILYATPTVLIPAKALINETTIRRRPRASVTYFHMMFDNHEIVLADGAESESLHIGKMAESSLQKEQLEEIYMLFPELEMNANAENRLCFPTMSVREGRAANEFIGLTGMMG